MKPIRSALTVLAISSAALLPACAEHDASIEHAEIVQTGRVSMALEATAASGARYRLRQAVFLVDRANDSGGLLGGGFGGGFGGMFGGPVADSGVGGLFGGGADGGSIELPGMAVPAEDAGFVDVPPTFVDSDAGVGLPIPDPFGATTFTRELSIDSEDNPEAPEVRKEVPTGDYRIFLTNGWFVERVDGPQPLEVQARLLGSATQALTVFSDTDSVISYTFETDGEVVTFVPRGGIVIRPQFIETTPDGGTVDSSVPPLSPAFGQLIELDRSVLATLSLRETLGAVGSNAGMTGNADLLYQSIIDSFASARNGRLPTAVHCGDETTDGAASLNGFPLECDRVEAQQFDNLDRWFATAAVSRLDLAPADGSNCGQQRLVFANNAINRMFMIVEAQIPNPNPSCGVAACAPIAAAWANLSSTDARSRSETLRAMFLNGSPELQAAGFGPFVSADNTTVGSGQIRTNSFDSFPWTLREFKVIADATRTQATAIPFPVAESPRGTLWNDTVNTPVAVACRQNFLDAMESLVTDDLGALRFIVDDACKDSESQNDFFTEDYESQLNAGTGAFAKAIDERFGGLGFSAADLANRARFGGSCIGCHQEASGLPLGHGLTAPRSVDFPQIQEFTEPCSDGMSSCSVVSPALRDVFLPQRLNVQIGLLLGGSCGEGPGFDGGVVTPGDAGLPLPSDGGFPAPSDGGGFFISDASVSFADGGVSVSDAAIGRSVDARTAAAPKLPSLSRTTSIDDLVAADQHARAQRTGITLGGQPARTTH